MSIFKFSKNNKLLAFMTLILLVANHMTNENRLQNHFFPLTKKATINYTNDVLDTLQSESLEQSTFALACGNNPVTLLAQEVATTTGSGILNIPSITNLNIPVGSSRAVFVLVNFERSHCQSGDNCTSSNSSGVGLGDNFASPTFLSGTYQITGRFSGNGGSVNYKNPLTSPDGDLRFGFQYGAAGSNLNATYLSRESYFIAIYENDMNTILGGAASGNIDITLPDVNAPLDAADEAIMYAFVFDNVQQTNFGIVRSGVNTSLDHITTANSSLPGNFTMSDTDLDNGQEPNEANDGLLVLGVSGLGASNTGGFNNISGFTKIAENKLTNIGGNYTTYNEGDGFSSAVFFRNGFSSGIINNVTIQSAASSSIAANGGMFFAFTIESCSPEICADGMDNDGDGLIDCIDSDCEPVISNINVNQPTCANKTGGQITITASGSGSLSYSITNDPSWQLSNTFSNLGVGQYTIRVRNDSGCEITDTNNPIILDISTCIEICDNNIDDDGDGKVDCEDMDCESVATGNTIENQ